MGLFSRSKVKVEQEVNVNTTVEQTAVLVRLTKVESDLDELRKELEVVKEKVEDDC